MRDRLDHLQTISESKSQLEEVESDSFSNVDLEDFSQHAVIFDNSDEMDSVLDEAQDTRREIQFIRLEVKRLRDQNTRILSEPTRTTHVKQDASVIVGDIKTRGQDVLSRLQKMDAHAKELEEEHGLNSAVARIARTQYATLSNNFRDAMTEYNDAEMDHKESCKRHIQRQMEIVGRDVTGDQIEEMLENGQWNIFNDNVMSEGKTARSALNQIERRHRDLLDLESRLQSLHEVFLDVAMLVEEQGPMTDYILNNVQKTDAMLGEVLIKLEQAKRHDNNNPFKKMFCGCFPCAKN
ncbi:syntaxin-11-like [Carassius auratus]|uniref:Syntaxin-11-like n=1 Tax=Carassius auratus TaxID=7957 RepID=A0A6P6N9P1_CARAU|nr:syntaxin-11-like [Carassius auratus]XP_026105781.1 syntaxin-11-like [Carassius auratus]XP_026105782.1 syntaxin-11-like [Carassius auratus]XP_026105783.1 syntaxin-11-like [Carassius auratus]XP_052442883.1 syntaxin-11-like [Carassius gibelio]